MTEKKEVKIKKEIMEFLRQPPEIAMGETVTKEELFYRMAEKIFTIFTNNLV